MRRLFSVSAFQLIKRNKLPPRPKFTHNMEAECEESFLHGGHGPGGQKINKCNSKVQLKHIPTGTVTTCQETRSRSQNRLIAREKMAFELNKLEHGGIAPREAAKKQLILQNKRSKKKKSVLKYSQHSSLNEEKKKQQNENDEVVLQSIFKDL